MQSDSASDIYPVQSRGGQPPSRNLSEGTRNGVAHDGIREADGDDAHADANACNTVSSSPSSPVRSLFDLVCNSPKNQRNAFAEGSMAPPSLYLLQHNLDSLSREFEQLTARGRSNSHSVAQEEQRTSRHAQQEALPKVRISSASNARSARNVVRSLPPVSPYSPRVRVVKSPLRHLPTLDKALLASTARASPNAAPLASPAITPTTARSPVMAAEGDVGRDASPLRRNAVSPDRGRDGRIRVAVRKRPLLPGDVGVDCVTIDPPRVHVAVTKRRVDLSDYEDVNDFVFDSVFDTGHTNADVFHDACAAIIDVVLAGGSASCFAYGQTGSGKTHTMMGGKGEAGLCAMAAAELFARMDSHTHVVCAALYEIYRNALFDLLNARAPVVLRETYNRRMHVCGLSWRYVDSAQALNELIRSGTEQRSTGNTSANEHSSRSHAVLAIRLCRRPTTATTTAGSPSKSNANSSIVNSPDEKCEERYTSISAVTAAATVETGGGVLNFVDLAGSERAADTAMYDRQTRREGAEINKSLLALKECIRALDEKKRHVPFRGSKLTEVLRDSFTGNSLTLMIANISGSLCDHEHTLNTLRYAFRVKGLSIESLVPSKARSAPRIYRPLPGDILHQQKLLQRQQEQQQQLQEQLNGSGNRVDTDAILRRPRPCSVTATQRRCRSVQPGGNKRSYTPTENRIPRKSINGINQKSNVGYDTNEEGAFKLVGVPSHAMGYEKFDEVAQQRNDDHSRGPSDIATNSSSISTIFGRVALSDKKLNLSRAETYDVIGNGLEQLNGKINARLALTLPRQNELIEKLRQENAALRESVRLLQKNATECPNCGWKLKQQ